MLDSMEKKDQHCSLELWYCNSAIKEKCKARLLSANGPSLQSRQEGRNNAVTKAEKDTDVSLGYKRHDCAKQSEQLDPNMDIAREAGVNGSVISYIKVAGSRQVKVTSTKAVQ